MCISPFTINDCNQASQLHKHAFFKGWEARAFLESLQIPFTFGLKVENDQNLSGYVLWRESGGEAEVLTFVVAPFSQRKGIGSLLLSTLLITLKEKDVKTLFLEVAEDNEKARSFYAKHGFDLLNKRPNYYARKNNTFVDALNLVKIV